MWVLVGKYQLPLSLSVVLLPFELEWKKKIDIEDFKYHKP